MLYQDIPMQRLCQCQNICVSGSHFQRLYKTGLSETIQQVIAHNSEPLIQIRSNGVTVDRPTDCTITKNNENSCTIQCEGCGYQCNVYIGKGNAFAQLKKNPNFKRSESSLTSSPKMPNMSVVPRTMRSLIALNESIEDYDHRLTEDLDDNMVFAPPSPLPMGEQDSDDDFDLMFSNTSEPIVGSYTESPMAVGFF